MTAPTITKEHLQDAYRTVCADISDKGDIEAFCAEHGVDALMLHAFADTWRDRILDPATLTAALAASGGDPREVIAAALMEGMMIGALAAHNAHQVTA